MLLAYEDYHRDLLHMFKKQTPTPTSMLFLLSFKEEGERCPTDQASDFEIIHNYCLLLLTPEEKKGHCMTRLKMDPSTNGSMVFSGFSID